MERSKADLDQNVIVKCYVGDSQLGLLLNLNRARPILILKHHTTDIDASISSTNWTLYDMHRNLRCGSK
jgi:hypothetical protein